ncbi:MAG: hypothetical protein QM734_16320 [Cyclobacteriaceae bacterium]
MKTTNYTDIKKLQLHYYFNDDALHSMDAFIFRNDNERNFLKYLKRLLTS